MATPPAELGRLTGDRVRDLHEAPRLRLATWLEQLISGEEGARLAKMVREVVPREEREERFAFGDTLPAGLQLLGSGA